MQACFTIAASHHLGELTADISSILEPIAKYWTSPVLTQQELSCAPNQQGTYIGAALRLGSKIAYNFNMLSSMPYFPMDKPLFLSVYLFTARIKFAISEGWKQGIWGRGLSNHKNRTNPTIDAERSEEERKLKLVRKTKRKEIYTTTDTFLPSPEPQPLQPANSGILCNGAQYHAICSLTPIEIRSALGSARPG
ncbi:uncharacterized protein RAG0_14847 [Rhynchosporium agropyri]|uniref:Uncharacterized protein n=1 Tax=Rhynchosporium agropyri TaxID=914238 RepID=A0A1E1LIL4_9HELO|nr:uncharacterized protein RAG0_14847 [Rhynchosporium agropyri]